MLIVGELINATRKAVGQAIREEDEDMIRQLARSQHEGQADFIDVNAGISAEGELQYLPWLVRLVQEAVPQALCCLDSPDPKAIEAAMGVHKGNAMINSISLEKERFDQLLPVIAGTDLKVIALCMSDDGMPETADQRFAIAEKLINALVSHNIPLENIHVDPLVQPLSTNTRYGVEFMSAVERIMTEFKGCHTICGLTNISYGLPERKLLNRIFLAMAAARGLDGVIIDPTDSLMSQTVYAARTLSGKDDFCMAYIKAFRSGLLSATEAD